MSMHDCGLLQGDERLDRRSCHRGNGLTWLDKLVTSYKPKLIATDDA